MDKAFNWRDGVTPGDDGSSLITGHAYAKGRSKFNRMTGVHVGDLIRITAPSGKVFTFKVTSVNRRAPHVLNERLESQLRSTLGPPRIAVYTCNAATYSDGEYKHGVVVKAKRVQYTLAA